MTFFHITVRRLAFMARLARRKAAPYVPRGPAKAGHYVRRNLRVSVSPWPVVYAQVFGRKPHQRPDDRITLLATSTI